MASSVHSKRAAHVVVQMLSRATASAVRIARSLQPHVSALPSVSIFTTSAAFKTSVRSLNSEPKAVSRKSRKEPNSGIDYGYGKSIDDRSFADLSELCMHSICDAVKHMVHINETFEIEMEPRELVIGLGKSGSFIFCFKHKNEILQLNSPVSGLLDYKYDRKQRQWRNVKDGHDFRGIVTRDFLRICSGCPDFR